MKTILPGWNDEIEVPFPNPALKNNQLKIAHSLDSERDERNADHQQV